MEITASLVGLDCAYRDVMKNLTALSLALVSIATLGSACATQDDSSADDELSDESDVQPEESKADGGSVIDSYFTVRAIRALGNPGSNPPTRYIIRRANASKTRCVDGSLREACSVSTLDFSAIRFAEMQERGLRGTLSQKVNKSEVALMVRGKMTADKFVAKEVWQQEADVSGVPNDGAFGVAVKIVDSGIRCITTPCPVIREEKLNSATTANIDNVKFPTDELSDRGFEAVFSGQSVMIIGYRKIVGGEKQRAANAVFFKIGN
jgi:hypothetical protein